MPMVSLEYFCTEQGISMDQGKKLIDRLDIPYTRTGKGETTLIMFDQEEAAKIIRDHSTKKRDRRKKRATPTQ